MRCLLPFTAILCLSVLSGKMAAAADQDEIKRAIPADSAMMEADFDKLAMSETSPKRSDVEDKSLTLILLTLQVKNDAKAKQQFRYLTKVPPKPSELAVEICHQRRTGKRIILQQPITFLQAHHIRDFTCDVQADRASGTVSFMAPNLYEGKVEYAAGKFAGKWFITEFKMPAYDITLVRGNDGLWIEKP